MEYNDEEVLKKLVQIKAEAFKYLTERYINFFGRDERDEVTTKYEIEQLIARVKSILRRFGMDSEVSEIDKIYCECKDKLLAIIGDYEYEGELRIIRELVDHLNIIIYAYSDEPENYEYRLSLKKIDEKDHWYVNNHDKGIFYTRKDSIKAKIINILYSQIGTGWITHETFINACAWNDELYFPSSGDPGRMQRQLTDIRKFLGVEIEFNKDKGVRFPVNVVKYR